MWEGLLNLLKFLLAILLILVVLAASRSFFRELTTLQNAHDVLFIGGAAYLIGHLFVVVPMGFYQFGQKVLTDIFRFSAPLSSILSYTLPFWTLLTLIVFYIVVNVFNLRRFEDYFLFAIGFLSVMHIVLTAQELHGKDMAGIKPHYFFVMSLVYVANLLIVAVFLDLIFDQFSFFAFCKSSFLMAKDSYSDLWHRVSVHHW